MKKITMKTSETIAETFDVYLLSKRAKGISDKTLTTYKCHQPSFAGGYANKPIGKSGFRCYDKQYARLRSCAKLYQ
ncbi:MAG: hypothetical protein E7403_00455 [Ruminococcaceae bacterium]|nr:hypothetical protein [Oscillospiraceae bacterium]